MISGNVLQSLQLLFMLCSSFLDRLRMLFCRECTASFQLVELLLHALRICSFRFRKFHGLRQLVF